MTGNIWRIFVEIPEENSDGIPEEIIVKKTCGYLLVEILGNFQKESLVAW